MPALFKRSIAVLQKDGGEKWKGKRIVSELEYRKNTNIDEAFAQPWQNNTFNLEYALSHFPDPVGAQFSPIFLGRGSKDIHDRVHRWTVEYGELIEHYRQIGRMPKPKPIIPIV